MTTAQLFATLADLLESQLGEDLDAYLNADNFRIYNVLPSEYDEAIGYLAEAFDHDVIIEAPPLTMSWGVETVLRKILRDPEHYWTLIQATGYCLVALPYVGTDRGLVLKRFTTEVLEATY